MLQSNATNSLINYVSLSRQVLSLQVFVNKQETRNKVTLIEQMSRDSGKAFSLKYLTEEQVNRAKIAKTLGDGYWDTAKEVLLDLKTNVQNKLSDFFHQNKEFYDIKGREQKGRQQVVSVDSSSLKSQDAEGKQWTWVKEPQLSTPKEQQQADSLIHLPAQSNISSPAKTKLAHMSPEDVKEALQRRTAELARDLLGEPARKGKREWRYGAKGSIAIFVEGPKKGLYANFEAGVYGNGLQLIQDHLGLNREESYKWALEWLGGDNRSYSKPQELAKSKIEEQKHTAWRPIFPVPDKAPKPDIETNPYLSYIAKDRQITALYEYKDHNGNLLGYVVRLEDREGGKITPTLTYCENEKGQQHWRWQGFSEGRPLYGQEKLVKQPTQPVLIVEGEKTADSAQKLFPNHVVISWPGGAGAVEKANWEPLLGRDLIIWPDHDKVGLKAARLIEDKLKDINESYRFKVAITTVDLPKDLPAKWDLADELPKNLSLKDLQNLVHKEQRHQEASLQNVAQIKGNQQTNKSQEHAQPEIKTNDLSSPLPHKQDRAEKLLDTPSVKKAKTLRSQGKVIQNSVEKLQDLKSHLSKETFTEVIDRFSLTKHLVSKPNEEHFKVATEVFKALEACAPPNQNMERLKERSVFIALRMDQYGDRYALEKPEALSRLLIESRLWHNLSRMGERIDMSVILHRAMGSLKDIEDTHQQKKNFTPAHKFMNCAFGIEKNIPSLEKAESSLQALTKTINEQRDIHRQRNLERERINELTLER